MKAAKFLVTLKTSDGRDRSDVWDSAAPMGLCHPFRYVLERSAGGVLIRRIDASATGVDRDSALIIRESSIEQGSDVKLPGGTGTVSLRRLKQIRPAYLADASPDRSKGEVLPQLLAFSGARRIVIGCSTIHSAFVAELRGKPLFTVYMSPDGYRVKPLLSGVSLKLKGRKSLPGKPGEAWAIPADQMSGATVFRGLHWWRFALVAGSGAADSERPASFAGADAEKDWFKHFSAAVAVFLIASILAIRAMPPRLETMAEKAPVPKETIVRFKPRVQALDPARIGSASEKPLPDPALEKLSAAEGGGSAQAVMTQAQPNPAGDASAKALEAPKVVAAPSSSSAPKGTSREQAKAARLANEARARARDSARKAAALRDLLGGAKTLAAKDSEISGGSDDPAAAQSVQGLFNPTAAAAAVTEVNPAFAAKSGKVAVLGGRALAESSDAGYGSRVDPKVAGQGHALVSMGAPGKTAVDEGLSKEEVSAAVQAHTSEVRYCYESALVYQPDIDGKVQIQFTIAASGAVSSATVQSSTLSEKSIEQCVLAKLRTWEFPKPKGRSEVTVSYPFLFKTLGKD